MSKTYAVHIYFTVKVKLPGIDAESQKDAIKQAEDKFDGLPAMLAKRGGYVYEFDDAEEITGYLVDEVGDTEYARSQFYTRNGNPVRHRARKQSALDKVLEKSDMPQE